MPQLTERNQQERFGSNLIERRTYFYTLKMA